MDHLINQIIPDLQRGKASVNQMRDLLLNQRPTDADHHGYFKGLDDHSMAALTALESVLEKLHNPDQFAFEDNPQFGNSKSQDSALDAPKKDRRGCYKRRRNVESAVLNVPNLTDDGHAWRKYGQKVILNTTHPRNYYRCTHKMDQGCQATKQVQQISDNPTMYRIIYHGEHTCKNLHKTPSIFIDSTTPENPDSSVYLSFGTNMNVPSAKQGISTSSLFFPNPVVKQECGPIKEETLSEPSDLHHRHHNQYNSSPSSPDPTTTTPRSEISSADVYSVASPHGVGMEEDYLFSNMMAESSIDLDHLLGPYIV